MSTPAMPPNSEPAAAPGSSPQDPHLAAVHRMEMAISTILRIGVVSSIGLILLGLVLMFYHHPDILNSQRQLGLLTGSEAHFPRSLAETFAGLGTLNGRAVIVAGLLLLILTPVVRVAVSIVAFALQNDHIYTLFTTIVLLLLIISFLLGKAG